MPVRGEDVAIGSDRDGIRLIEGVRSVARDSRLAERHQDLSLRIELEDLVALSIFALAVGEP